MNLNRAIPVIVGTMFCVPYVKAQFCTSCGAKVDQSHKFCSSCGQRLTPGFDIAPSGADPKRENLKPDVIEKIEIEEIQEKSQEDSAALEFLKSILLGKRYYGDLSRRYIEETPPVIELDIARKSMERSRGTQKKFLYEIQLLTKRESGDAGLFGRSYSFDWEPWMLRVQRNPTRILAWNPESVYDGIFRKRPRAETQLTLPSFSKPLAQWVKQRQRLDKNYRTRSNRSSLASYESVFTSPALSIDRAFPFLYKDTLITSMLHLCGSKVKGNSVDLVSVRLINNLSTDQTYRVRSSIQDLSFEAVDTVVVPSGESIEVGLSPSLRTSSLKIEQKRPTAIKLQILGEDGAVIFEETKRIEVLPRNDFIFEQSKLPFLAAFVTPNLQLIDQLNITASKITPHGYAAGYQGNEDSVIEEVRAIYKTISGLGVTYRSNTLSFLNDDELFAQRIAYPVDSLAGAGANCIDGAVLFASAFEALGMRSVLVLGPNHAFVGLYLSEKSSQIFPIETTMVGTQPFEAAVQSAMETFKQWQANGKLILIDVNEARDLGVSPFPYPSDNPLVLEKLRQLAGH